MNAASELAAACTAWGYPLIQHLDGVDLESLGESRVPTDIVNSADRLLQQVRNLADEGRVALPYTGAMIQHLEPLVERARQAHTAQQEGLAELQQRRRELRLEAVRFEGELNAFRRVLRKLFGPQYHDYRYLTIRRGTSAAAEAVELEAEAAPAVAVAGEDGADQSNEA